MYDKNEIRINGNICEMDLYNSKGAVIATTVFNKNHFEKVQKEFYIVLNLSQLSPYIHNLVICLIRQ